MLRVAIRHVVSDRVDELRQWLGIVNTERRSEALATLVDETCAHAQAPLIDGKHDPILVYVMEVEDGDRSRRAPERSVHPIDLEHREVVQRAVGDPVPAETLLDVRP